ncbi:MAG: sulfatase-like hydrolase/transferase [Pseudomonadota bacterium]
MTRMRFGALLSLLLATAVLYGLLVLPNRPSALQFATLQRVPLELPVLLGTMLVLSAYPRLSRAVLLVLVIALTATILLKAADFATYEAFYRPFNLVIDRPLIPAGLNLLTGALGQVAAVGLVVFAGLVVLFIGWSAWWALARWTAVSLPRSGRWSAGAIAAIFAAWAVADTGHVLQYWKLPSNPPGTALTSRLAYVHVNRTRTASQNLAVYRSAALYDAWGQAPGVLDLLDGRDVLIIFLESYGRTSFDNPLYAPTHLPRLQEAETALATEGLAMRSLWLTSPIQGGQSWLAHGTLASGLRTSDHARYRAMVASPRKTLFHFAQEAGYRTGAVKPAITMAWPEGPALGFETILTAEHLDYAGAPFNWVTMPDQYTLAAYPAQLGDDPRPDFLQITLISSHAPWTPVPWKIDWASIGDGRIFDGMAASGETPREVWKNRDKVRDHYRRSVDYALDVTFSFVARQAGPDAPLIIVVGDHQPAPSISQIDSMDVPMHLIGPPEILSRLDGWGAAPGLVPGANTPVWPMEDFRDRFLAAFTSDPGPS